ncbi:MAG: DNA-directed RNA polymerase subunit omega [Verrucomicrobia bacterium]|nr:DNA-directed RNA polymerase subunit omega [Verrucomicrobiota bacterium]
MRDDYLQNARAVIDDPNILINLVSRRVKQLRQGSRPLVESLEKLSPEDTALREIAEGKITYLLPTTEELANLSSPTPTRSERPANGRTFKAPSLSL